MENQKIKVGDVYETDSRGLYKILAIDYDNEIVMAVSGEDECVYFILNGKIDDDGKLKIYQEMTYTVSLDKFRTQIEKYIAEHSTEEITEDFVAKAICDRYYTIHRPLRHLVAKWYLKTA